MAILTHRQTESKIWSKDDGQRQNIDWSRIASDEGNHNWTAISLLLHKSACAPREDKSFGFWTIVDSKFEWR